MEREVGGGIGMGSACKPMALSFQCMTKSTTIKKINKIKINKYIWLPSLDTVCEVCPSWGESESVSRSFEFYSL